MEILIDFFLYIQEQMKGWKQYIYVAMYIINGLVCTFVVGNCSANRPLYAQIWLVFSFFLGCFLVARVVIGYIYSVMQAIIYLKNEKQHIRNKNTNMKYEEDVLARTKKQEERNTCVPKKKKGKLLQFPKKVA